MTVGEHKLLLRLPLSLWGLLRECARENHRSVNAEIVYRLRRSVEGYQR